MNVQESLARDILRLFVWFPLRWATGIIPIDTSLFLFKLLGDLHFSIGRKKSRDIRANMAAVLKAGDRRVSDNVRRYFENHYLDRLHIFLNQKFSSDNIQRYVLVEGLENIDAELAKGRGCILVQPHFGPVQISLLTLSLLGYDMLQIGFPSDDGLSMVGKTVAFKYRLKYEDMLPPIIPADKFMGPVFRHLMKNGIVMTTGDGAGGGKKFGKHMEMDFLGTRRMVPLGPASLSVKKGVSLLPTFIFVERFNRFRLVIKKPLAGENSGDQERDVLTLTEQFLRMTEQCIINSPHNFHFWDEFAADGDEVNNQGQRGMKDTEDVHV